MDEFLNSLPTWAGTVPQWGMLLSFVFAVWKLSFADSTAIRKEMAARIEKLKDDHEQCTQDLDQLRNELHGMRQQRIDEQLAIMRAIVRMSNDPDVKRQLALLESMERQKPKEVDGVEGDSEK